jgi:acetyl-CoA synthetase
MLNVSGHLLSTAEVESAIIGHKAVAEAAAVSTPHPIKGECIYCFVVLKNGFEFSKELERDIKRRGKYKSCICPTLK